MVERKPDFPLHRLNIPRTKMWLVSKSWQAEQAKILARGYRGGVGICSATCRLFAFVEPGGNVRELKRPFRKYEMWQMTNAPKAPECPCGEYFDPEVQGPYKERGPEAGHHPMCQFEQTAGAVFKQAQGQAANRMGLVFEFGVPVIDPMRGATNSNAAGAGKALVKSLTPQARPDEWEKLRKEYRGK